MTKYVGFGVIRDKDGNPRIDDPANLHPAQVLMLSDQERSNLGLWGGCFARDAQGFKRLTQLGPQKFRAEENLVAVNEILIADGDVRAVLERRDIPAGTEFNIT